MPAGEDITGRVFGYLRVIKKTKRKNASNSILWRCQCDCGKSLFVAGTQLRAGNRISCGCAKNPDYSGQRFGSLKVIKPAAVKRSEAGSHKEWICQCDCGNKTILATTLFRSGRVKTCGCHMHMKGINNPKAQKIIGAGKNWLPSSDPWYQIAASAKQRAKRDSVPFGFESIMEMAYYLKQQAPKKCPVFGMKLQAAKDSPENCSPSLDKIIPRKGYVKGNLQVMSHLANSMKRDATPKQLKRFANWILGEI